MIGNKRPSVVSGRLNFPVKKKLAPLPSWIDKDPVPEAISGIQMPVKRRFVDLGTVPVPRPTGPRADKKRENKKVESSRWTGSTYCLLDNNLYGSGLSTLGATNTLFTSPDYKYPDILVPSDDTSRTAQGMFSAPIGLRVMQQHYGARAGSIVGPTGAYNGSTPNLAYNALIDASTVDAAWERGVLMPDGVGWDGSFPTSSADGSLLSNGGSTLPGSMWYNQLGFQWCPIGVNHLDANDFAKLSDYKYFRFKKFGMRITFDGPTFHRAKKNEVMTSYQYAPPVSATSGFFGASNQYHGEGLAFGNGGAVDNGWRGDASIDRTVTDIAGTARYNTTRAGPKYSCVQPYGVYDYMIIGPEKLQQIDLPGLMGYSDKLNSSTLGLGAIHVWDTLREHGIPVHRAKKNYIDVEWKPYAVNLLEDSAVIGDVPYMDQTVAGPYGPSVEIVDLQRKSSSQITPNAAVNCTTAFRDALKTLPISNGYPYAHIGPVVLVRFAADPGVTASPYLGSLNTDLQGMACSVNPICASVPVHVKCWSTYEAYGEDFDTFDTSTLDMWKVPVKPAVYPYNNTISDTVDPTNAG